MNRISPFPVVFGLMMRQQIGTTWGRGPLTWTIDPGGIEQVGASGQRVRLPWSPTSVAEVEGPVLRVAGDDGADQVVVPLRAFQGDQLDRVLAWSVAGTERPAT